VRRAWQRAKGAAAGSAAMTQARDELSQALRTLQAIAGLQPTIERLSLCGSAWKRLGQLEARDGRAADSRAALLTAADNYGRAEELAAASAHPELFYPALNRMAIALVLGIGPRARHGFPAAALERARQSLHLQHTAAPDFWTHASFIDLEFYKALAQGSLAARAATLTQAWADLHARVTTPGNWGSIADQALFVLQPLLAAEGDAKAAAVKLLAQLDGYARSPG